MKTTHIVNHRGQTIKSLPDSLAKFIQDSIGYIKYIILLYKDPEDKII